MNTGKSRSAESGGTEFGPRLSIARYAWIVPSISSAEPKDLLPRLLVLRELSDVVDGQHVRRRGSDFFQRFRFGMSRSFARLSINLLPLFADGPANPE